MTGPELARVSADMPQPVDPYLGPCRAYVSEVGGVWRIVWALDGGRRKVPAGPAFPIDRAGGRDVRRLCGVLNGDTSPAPRPGQHDSAGPGGPTSGDEAAQPEAPVDHHPVPPGSVPAVSSATPPPDPTPAAGGRTCAGCGGPLPEARRGQRRLTCSPACRERARYHRAANARGADAQGGDPNLTPSRAPEVPTPRPGEEVSRFASSPARDAVADLFPESSASGVPTLGL